MVPLEVHELDISRLYRVGYLNSYIDDLKVEDLHRIEVDHFKNFVMEIKVQKDFKIGVDNKKRKDDVFKTN